MKKRRAMKNLILTSGGYFDGQRGQELDELIEKISYGKKVLMVENATITGCVVASVKPTIFENFKKLNTHVGMLVINENNLDKIFDYDVIYLMGGDNLPMIEIAKIANISEAFRKFLSKGGYIIGESGGSMIFGKDLKWRYDVMKTVKPQYNITLPSYKGLGLLDLNIYPHWNKRSEKERQIALEYEKTNNIKIKYLNDGEWLEFGVEDLIV